MMNKNKIVMICLAMASMVTAAKAMDPIYPGWTLVEGQIGKDGLCYGHCTLEHKDGDISDGEFSKGRMVRGTLITEEEMFTGEFVDGTYEGKGILEHKDGHSHIGYWKGGQPNGRGFRQEDIEGIRYCLFATWQGAGPTDAYRIRKTNILPLVPALDSEDYEEVIALFDQPTLTKIFEDLIKRGSE